MLARRFPLRAAAVLLRSTRASLARAVRASGPRGTRLVSRRIGVPALVILATAGLGTFQPADAAAATFTNPAPIEGRTASGSAQNLNPITMSATGTPTGSVYPSTATITGVPGTTTYLEVALQVQHTAPDDLDVLLVAPGGQTVVLMSDAGGYSDYSGFVTFNTTSSLSLPDTTQLAGNSYMATNWVGNDVAGDVWPAPAPAVPDPNASLDTLVGESPNGTWQLYVRDDQDQDGGTIVSWRVSMNTDAFPTPAATYPSTIPVSGLTGSVSDVDLTLNGVSWYYSYDLDVMLVSPDGRKALVMSDAGIGQINDATLVLDDEASEEIPAADPMPSGRYRPTNLGDGDSFPSPAPDAATASTDLSVFDGADPNGVWSLYVVHDWPDLQNGDIADGWSLTITTTSTTTAATGSVDVAPRIIATRPPARATGVRRGADIRATASKSLDPGSVTGSTVYVTRAGSGRHIGATISYQSGSDTILIDPSRRLRAGTKYRVVVTTSVRDSAGTPLDQDPGSAGAQQKVWTFRTR